jgi:hypothetical protein
MSGKLIRSISLVFVIVFGAIFCICMWIGYKQESYMIVPAVAFTGIYVWILLCELWGAFTGYKKTLSTRYTHWTKNHKWLSLFAIISFVIAMIALAPHLWVYW